MSVPLYHSGTGLFLAGFAVCMVGLLVSDKPYNYLKYFMQKDFFIDYGLNLLFYMYADMQSFICQYSFPVILKTVLRVTSPWCSAVSTTSG